MAYESLMNLYESQMIYKIGNVHFFKDGLLQYGVLFCFFGGFFGKYKGAFL